MPDIDPLSIFFFVVRMAVAILLIVGFVIIYNLLNVEVKIDDLDRFSIQVSDSIANSQLAKYSYVFDTSKLDEWSGWSNVTINEGNPTQEMEITKELPFLRSCFSYYAEVEDLRTGRTWKFGHVPRFPPYISVPNKIGESKLRVLDVGINLTDSAKPGDSYEAVIPARLTVTAYDSWLARLTCAVERAHDTKKIQNLTMPSCLSDFACVSLRYQKDKEVACIFDKEGGTSLDWDCRYFPNDVKFDDFFEASNSLPRGIKADKAHTIKAYPLRSTAACETVRQNPANYVVSGAADVTTVLLCLEE